MQKPEFKVRKDVKDFSLRGKDMLIYLKHSGQVYIVFFEQDVIIEDVLKISI
jgi:hypothetical protein